MAGERAAAGSGSSSISLVLLWERWCASALKLSSLQLQRRGNEGRPAGASPPLPNPCPPPHPTPILHRHPTPSPPAKCRANATAGRGTRTQPVVYRAIGSPLQLQSAAKDPHSKSGEGSSAPGLWRAVTTPRAAASVLCPAGKPSQGQAARSAGLHSPVPSAKAPGCAAVRVGRWEAQHIPHASSHPARAGGSAAPWRTCGMSSCPPALPRASWPRCC